MQDPTCEKVRADHPNGCTQRRCDKSRSVHNKICTDDSAATQCTLDECEQKCKDHVDFTCTTYAYDTAEKECYLFETCENEQFDADYNTYVLIDPTCEEQRGTTNAPGCNQRRCDKSVTPHVKICVDDTPEQQCTKDECEIHCSEKIFTDERHEAFCTHWAYDAVDKECYIFHGCVGEQYDDDYELFFQSYGERMALQGTPLGVVSGGARAVAVSAAAALRRPGSFTSNYLNDHGRDLERPRCRPNALLPIATSSWSLYRRHGDE